MKRIPTWALYLSSFLILHIGSHISLLAKHDLAVSDFYLPTATSVVLVSWFGPRIVVPVVFLNAVVTSPLWGNSIDEWHLWFLYAVPETLFCFLSWLLFIKTLKGRYWFPDNRNTVRFLIAAILIPAVVESVLLQLMLVLYGGLSPLTLKSYIFSNVVSEFATTFFLTLPILYYVTPLLQNEGIIHPYKKKIPQPDLPHKKDVTRIGITFAALLVLVFFLEFQRYWYIYGFFSLYVAIKLGFGPAIITNLYILSITYIIPKFISPFGIHRNIDFANAGEILLGANALFVFVAITGRVISDLKIAEARLVRQNNELEHTNQELDRFVYSVSHDLTAPLKSILGIVSISRLTNDLTELHKYFGMIQKSVTKMEAFIIETLDYSRNKRQHIAHERIEIRALCEELLDNLFQPGENTGRTNITYNLHEPIIVSDRIRLRIILNNILSNALRFRKNIPDEPPSIFISSRITGPFFILQVSDNGEGIAKEQHRDIFRMFYRGSEKSTGSGLGLYIAREAASRLGGNISVLSDIGKGSTFTIKIRI